MKKKARFWETKEGKTVQCLLCPHQCILPDDKRGICGVRKNEGGQLVTLIYGSCSSVAADPIEKKPLYHFYPGTLALSLGTVGCSFTCDYCQNYEISTPRPEEIRLQEIPPEEAIKLAHQYGCEGIAWTYNEPTIWHEYTVDSAKLAKKEGLYTVYVTNGFINEAPLNEIAPYLDAMNIDIKAFHEQFYKTVCKGRLKPVLATCKTAKTLGIHLEVTYLVIPGKNDSSEEIKEFCEWVVTHLGPETPVHFSRFHPQYKMTQVPLTPMKTLMNAYELAKQAGVLFPFLGNVPHGNYDNTFCPSCGSVLIERHGFSSRIKGIDKGKCTRCGHPAPFIHQKR
jgi:pyruvate formate lyase activating enzyme